MTTSVLPTLLITPRRAALLAGHDNELDVLVRVQAPNAPAEQTSRHSLHLALVIDRSGSMSGPPLAEAKRCAEFVLDGLMPNDRLSVVAYDDHVQTLIPAVALHDKENVRRAIRRINSGGSTNLHGGWLQGAGTLAPHTTERITSRVILLSDGCANHGIDDPDQIFAQCADLARAGVTTSTYGLGNGFNERLMIGMARHGQGSSYYGQTADDLMDPFREEFALLNALCARRLRLELDLAPGVTARMLNDYMSADENAWLMPDLAYAGEAWAVIRLRVPKSVADTASGLVSLLRVSVRYTGLDGEPRAIKPASLALEGITASAFDAVAEDELVARRAGELEAARLQEKARDAARRRDWDGVGAALMQAERIGERNPWVADAVGELRVLASRRDEQMFVKEASFSAHRMHTRLAAQDETDGDSLNVAAFLRRKKSQGKGDKPSGW